MNLSRSTPKLLGLLAGSALACLLASCASQGTESSSPATNDDADDAGTVIEVPDSGAAPCTESGWCATSLPVPSPVSLNGIWGTDRNDVWIVGSPDLAIHWNGTEFSWSSLNTNQTIFGIWGSGPLDIWAFSTGDVLWHNSGGGNWFRPDRDAAPMDQPWTGPVSAMWGRSATDIWAVGLFQSVEQMTVWHSDGWNQGVPSWTPSRTTPDAMDWQPEPSFHGIWGSAAGDVWVVGEGGKTRWSPGWRDGAAQWTVVDSLTSFPLYAVWGSGSGQVWAVGGGGTVRRFTTGADGTIAVEEIPFPNRASLRALLGFGPNDLWVAGSEGTLAHWDGTSWSLVDLGTIGAGDRELFALWASGSDDIWAVGRDALLRKRTPSGWTP